MKTPVIEFLFNKDGPVTIFKKTTTQVFLGEHM